MNLDNLIPITKNSTRGSNENFDIHHHAESNKFTVSDDLFVKLNLANNGFTAYLGDDMLFLAVMPNEEAVSYKGRKGFEKSKVFLSTEMSKYFSNLNLEGELFLHLEGTKNNIEYYRVSTEKEVAESVVSETETEIETEEVL